VSSLQRAFASWQRGILEIDGMAVIMTDSNGALV